MKPSELARYLWEIYYLRHPHPKGAPIIRDPRGRPNFFLALNLAKALHAYARALGINPAMIDPMELDPRLSYEEAINYIRSKIPKKDEDRYDPLRYAYWVLEQMKSREPLSPISLRELQEYREALSIIRRRGMGLRRRYRIPKSKIKTLDNFMPYKLPPKQSRKALRRYLRKEI